MNRFEVGIAIALAIFVGVPMICDGSAGAVTNGSRAALAGPPSPPSPRGVALHPTDSGDVGSIPTGGSVLRNGALVVWHGSPVTTDAVEAPTEAQDARNLLGVLKAAASAYGADAGALLRVAQCESGMRADAVGDHGAAVGIMQFHSATFLANAARARLPYTSASDRLDPAASFLVAAYMFASGHADAWSCR